MRDSTQRKLDDLAVIHASMDEAIDAFLAADTPRLTYIYKGYIIKFTAEPDYEEPYDELRDKDSF